VSWKGVEKKSQALEGGIDKKKLRMFPRLNEITGKEKRSLIADKQLERAGGKKLIKMEKRGSHKACYNETVAHARVIDRGGGGAVKEKFG